MILTVQLLFSKLLPVTYYSVCHDLVHLQSLFRSHAFLKFFIVSDIKVINMPTIQHRDILFHDNGYNSKITLAIAYYSLDIVNCLTSKAN